MDKPPGLTSARVVARVKRLLPKGTKVGHTGALDPLASGLLILMLGRATRLSRYVTGRTKSYEATARFGARSDTLDADGVITALPDAPMPDEEDISAAAQRFTGELLQVPPMASAVKVGGERLYKAHRRGEEIERQPRAVTVSDFTLTHLEGETATFEIKCSSGTYVRSLVADLAASLDTAAYLTALRRRSVHDFRVSEAVALDSLTAETLIERIIQPEALIKRILPVVSVPEATKQLVCDGRPLESSFGVPESGVPVRYGVFCGDEFLAVYRDEPGGVARPEVVLCAG